MLLGDFYSIVKEESTPGSIKALLSLNQEHAILKGHFPGQPVVPGVCMMQMVKELLEGSTRRKLQLKEAENIKFLSVIDPRQNQEIEASVSYSERNGSIILEASLFSGAIIFFKLKAILQNA